MIDKPKTTSDQFSKNETVCIIPESIIATHFRQLERKWMCTIVIIVLLWTLTGALFGIYITQAILTRNSTHMNLSSTSNITGEFHNDSIKNISRDSWMAQAPTNKLAMLELPVTRIIIAHTATENCTTQESCIWRVRAMQSFHMQSRGWDDIGYNFLIGGDGAVYVGRGWDIQGAHTKGYNANSICIAFIGTFTKKAPPTRQLYAAQKLIEDGVKLEKLRRDYKLYGHLQMVPTDSPGLALYEIIKKWEHWTEKTS